MRTLVAIAAGFGVVFAVIAAIGVLTGDDVPEPGLPSAAAGLVRLDPDDAVRQADARMDGRGSAARYGRPGADRADVLVVLAADRRSGAAADKLERFYAGLGEAGVTADRARAAVQDPGPGGGALQCLPVTYPEQHTALDLCVWADAHTVGSVLALPDADGVGTVAELAALTRQMRAAVDRGH